jgi:ribosome-binding factor A
MCGKRMRLRSVPYIKFHYDTSFENGMRVSELLAQFPAVSDAEEDED